MLQLGPSQPSGPQPQGEDPVPGHAGGDRSGLLGERPPSACEPGFGPLHHCASSHSLASLAGGPRAWSGRSVEPPTLPGPLGTGNLGLSPAQPHLRQEAGKQEAQYGLHGTAREAPGTPPFSPKSSSGKKRAQIVFKSQCLSPPAAVLPGASRGSRLLT